MKHRDEPARMYRIHQIDEKIRDGQYPNAKSLAKELEVTERTINRDFATPRDNIPMRHVPMQYNAKKHRWDLIKPSLFQRFLKLLHGIFTSSD